jgi:hypothetical protein
MNDFQGQIEEQRGKLKELLLKVPGFKGYIEMEDRRTGDKLMRETVADHYQELIDQLTSVQASLVDEGYLEFVDDLENIVVKLRTFIDRIRHASYGYSSFFSAVKIDAETLDRLYEYDRSLLEGIDQFRDLIAALEQAQEEEEVKEAVSQLQQLSRQIVSQADQRAEVITQE